MVKGIYHSAAGMLARQRSLEANANNLANASTTGFKPETVCFRQTLASSLGPVGPSAEGELLVEAEGSGAARVRQGTLEPTGNPLDAAIVGEGFFAVQTPAGMAYTRDGRFQLDSDGRLVTLDGYPVATQGGTVTLPPGEVSLGPDGAIRLKVPGQETEQLLDRLQVVTFADLSQLRHADGGLYVTAQEPAERLDPRLEVGYLEASTVNPVTEMIKLVEIQQLHEASARAMTIQDQTLARAVNDVGKV